MFSRSQESLDPYAVREKETERQRDREQREAR